MPLCISVLSLSDKYTHMYTEIVGTEIVQREERVTYKTMCYDYFADDGPCGYEISGYEELGCKKSTIDAPHLFLDNNLHFHNNLASKSPEAISWDTDLSYANSDDVVVLPETKTELCPLSSEDQAGSSSMQVRWKWNVNETQGAVV